MIFVYIISFKGGTTVKKKGKFFSRNFTSGAQYPEINWFPSIVTRKSINFRVTIPRNQLISGYHDPEVKFRQFLFLFLNSCTTFKTDYIYKNHLSLLLSTCLGLWLEVLKKWGHLRIIFLTSRYRDPEVKNIFVNISAKTKIF